MSDTGMNGDQNYREEKAPLLRKVIARRMLESKTTIPHFYLTVDIDPQNFIDLRKEFNANGTKKISFNDIIIKAVAVDLKNHPECNKVIVDDRMIERSYGDLQRKFHKTVIKKYGKKQFDIWHRSYDVSPPRGESIIIVEKRVLSFIQDLVVLMKRKRVSVVISAHGNSMRPFRRYFENLTIKQMMELENPYDKYFDYVVES